MSPSVTYPAATLELSWKIVLAIYIWTRINILKRRDELWKCKTWEYISFIITNPRIEKAISH